MKRLNALLVSVTWLGDAVMALPAIQLWREANPGYSLSVLSKPGLTAFWERIPGIRAVLTLQPGPAGTRSAIRAVAAGSFDIAWILPNSFRSAWIPWKARVPRRRGLRGHWRRALLTDIAVSEGSRPPRQTEHDAALAGQGGGEPLQPNPSAPYGAKAEANSSALPGSRHQAWETLAILGLPRGPLPPPHFPFDEVSERTVISRFDLSPTRPLLGVFPGAARGPAKRWPPDRLIEALCQARRQIPALRICLLGSAAEAPLCATTAAALAGGADNFAGQTPLPELAALLARCDAVLCNDSGGMHLAAAVGTPTVAIFGLTDPDVTGPLGQGHIVLCPPAVQGTRRIARRSQAAMAALRQIRPETAAAAVVQLLSRRSQACHMTER